MSRTDERLIGRNPFTLEDPRHEQFERISDEIDEAWEREKSAIFSNPVPVEANALIEWACQLACRRLDIIAAGLRPCDPDDFDIYLRILDTIVEGLISRAVSLAPSHVDKTKLKVSMHFKLLGRRSYHKAEALRVFRARHEQLASARVEVVPSTVTDLNIGDSEAAIKTTRVETSPNARIQTSDAAKEAIRSALNRDERKTAVELWQARQRVLHKAATHTSLYDAAGQDKAEFYKWLRGGLKKDGQADRDIRKALLS